MKLFTYADRFETPLQQACLNSLMRHNPTATIFTPDTLSSIPGGREFRDKYRFLSPTHFSDLFRVWYILQQDEPTAWIDADCIHLRTMELPPGHNDNSMSFCYEDSSRSAITQSFLCSSSKCSFLMSLFERQKKLIDDKGANLEYLDLGEWSINHLRQYIDTSELNILPHWEHHYIPWYNAHWFHDVRHWGNFQFDRGHYNPNAYCYHLTNAVIYHYKDISLEYILDFNAFISFLLTRALYNGYSGCKEKEILKRLPDIHYPYKYLEVGVYKGYNLAIIGQQRYHAKIYGIDLWKNQNSIEYQQTNDDLSHMSDDAHEQAYQETLAHTWFLRSQGRIALERAHSLKAATAFTDHSLDMVFLDGDHSYNAVIKDVNAWKNKVKKDGWLGGHDYAHPGYNFGVKKAIDELFPPSKIELGDDYTWWIKME